MVEVGVTDEDVVDAGQFVERQVAHAGAGVDQDVVVDQEGGGLVAGGNGTGTTQNADFHGRGMQ